MSAPVIAALRKRAQELHQEAHDARKVRRPDIALFRLMLSEEFRALADEAEGKP